MFLRYIISSLILGITIELCNAACGCKQKGIKVTDFKVDDMILQTNDILEIHGFKAAIGEKWPNKEVKYKFDPGFPDKNKAPLRDFLKTYVGELSNCVKFTESSTGVYATVKVSTGCSASVGYSKTNALSINLADGCINKRNVKHEFTHSLGFKHEHSRPDRDNHLEITFANVDTAQCRNFYKCEGCKTTTTYDFDSIMQYPSNSFSCNKKDTMLKKTGRDRKIPFNMEVTKLDAKKVKDYYGC